MTPRLLVHDGGVVNNDLPRHRPHRTSPLTRGTRLLGPKLWKLLPQCLFDCSLDDRPSGIDGDLFQGVKVEIEAGPLIAKGTDG